MAQSVRALLSQGVRRAETTLLAQAIRGDSHRVDSEFHGGIERRSETSLLISCVG